MNPRIFLLLNLALAFYNIGTIWAHEVDIFRAWRLLDAASFPGVQSLHWRKLPYWVFAPVALSLMGATALVWYRPTPSPPWVPYGALAAQLASHLLTAIFWGPWQAKLSRDPRAGASPWLARILATHWLRTLLINLYGALLLVWAVRVLA